jgi:hypothetical protein
MGLVTSGFSPSSEVNVTLMDFIQSCGLENLRDIRSRLGKADCNKKKRTKGAASLCGDVFPKNARIWQE